jgi:hypothetical protein
MNLDDVMGFYYESVFGGSKSARPRGYETRGGQDKGRTNRTLARLFVESVEMYDVVKEQLDQWLNGSGQMTEPVKAFVMTMELKLIEKPIFFALGDDSRPTTTVEAVIVPSAVIVREKRAWRRKNPRLSVGCFAPSFRAWRDKNGRWLAYEIDLPPAN